MIFILGQVLDIFQYYLNLDEANESGNDTWQLEYQATEYYSVTDLTTESLAELASRLQSDDEEFSRYYLANGVRFDPSEEWDEETRVVHCCSMVHSHYDDYLDCYAQHMHSSTPTVTSSLVTVLLTTVLLLL